MRSVGAATPSAKGAYGISPAGTYLFAPADEGEAIEIAYTYAIGDSFTPNLTPVYDLADADFVDEKGNKDPVQVARVDPYSLPTIQRVECLSRSNEYATIPVEARDQSQIELFGVRVGTTIQAHEICDEINVARSSRRPSCSGSSMCAHATRSNCRGNIACSIRWTS